MRISAALASLMVFCSSTWGASPEFCAPYAERAVAQYRAMMGRASCRLPDSPRWQPNYTKHFNGCRGGTRAHLEAELAARDGHLLECGAIAVRDGSRGAKSDTDAGSSPAMGMEPTHAAEGAATPAASRPKPAASPQTPRQSSVATEVDAAKQQRLELKGGCWDVSTVATEEGFTVQQTPEEARRTVLASMTPSQRAVVTPQQVDQGVAALIGSQKFMAQARNKGGGGRALYCTNAPFADVAADLFGTPDPAMPCTRTVEAFGSGQRFRSTCARQAEAPVKDGQTYQIVDDYVRADAENFKGSQRKVTRIDAQRSAWAVTTTVRGKWTGELTPHAPHSPAPTDLDGKRPLGPEGVARRDPFRIVAVLGKENYTAVRAYILLHFVSAETARKYGSRIQDVLQRIYEDAVVIHETEQRHISSQHPWVDKMKAAGWSDRDLSMFYMALDVPSSTVHSGWDEKATWRATYSLLNPVEAMERSIDLVEASLAGFQVVADILREAYFSQAGTEAEKHALLDRLRAESKLTVVDPDFFVAVKPAASAATE